MDVAHQLLWINTNTSTAGSIAAPFCMLYAGNTTMEWLELIVSEETSSALPNEDVLSFVDFFTTTQVASQQQLSVDQL